MLNSNSSFYNQVSDNVYIIAVEHNVPAAATCFVDNSWKKKYYTVSVMEDNWQYMTPDMKLQQIRSLICEDNTKANRLCQCNSTNWNIFKNIDLTARTPVSDLVN